MKVEVLKAAESVRASVFVAMHLRCMLEGAPQKLPCNCIFGSIEPTVCFCNYCRVYSAFFAHYSTPIFLIFSSYDCTDSKSLKYEILCELSHGGFESVVLVRPHRQVVGLAAS